MTEKADLTVLQDVYLEALGMLNRLKDDCPRSEEYREKARQAAHHVHTTFAEMGSKGALKEFNQNYKRLRLEKKAKGEPFMPWPVYLHEEMRRMISSIALEDLRRAKRGLKR